MTIRCLRALDVLVLTTASLPLTNNSDLVNPIAAAVVDQAYYRPGGIWEDYGDSLNSPMQRV